MSYSEQPTSAGSAFKLAFKKYKQKKPTPPMDDVIDISRLDRLPDHIRARVHTRTLDPPTRSGCEGLALPPQEWNVFTIDGLEGLLYIRNPFTVAEQQRWIWRCLGDYPQKPNMSNLDAHHTFPEGYNIWAEAQKAPDTRPGTSGAQKRKRNEVDDSSAAANENKLPPPRQLLSKLRWVTLGYHYNWTTKEYNNDHHSTFPPDLDSLCQHLSTCLGFGPYKSEAAIVNYYQMGSTLSGHTDHSEFSFDPPLFSFSFGNSNIFLIGGHTLDMEPTPLVLHSGDIIVMSGPSRLAYHGVPQILPTDLQWLQEGVKDETWGGFAKYIKDARINVNVRQVFAHK
eukprot:comp17236_c1_seq1/m.16262 comp17236_c1_seq1/g.16262  ORF comp17236_c1_seq1/g.16262 comp17236_c1_seq1/m.16262 type:complete len:340 (-) comp17236_c1_seq1:430-1449(-)